MMKVYILLICALGAFSETVENERQPGRMLKLNPSSPLEPIGYTMLKSIFGKPQVEKNEEALYKKYSRVGKDEIKAIDDGEEPVKRKRNTPKKAVGLVKDEKKKFKKPSDLTALTDEALHKIKMRLDNEKARKDEVKKGSKKKHSVSSTVTDKVKADRERSNLDETKLTSDEEFYFGKRKYSEIPLNVEKLGLKKKKSSYVPKKVDRVDQYKKFRRPASPGYKSSTDLKDVSETDTVSPLQYIPNFFSNSMKTIRSFFGRLRPLAVNLLHTSPEEQLKAAISQSRRPTATLPYNRLRMQDFYWRRSPASLHRRRYTTPQNTGFMNRVSDLFRNQRSMNFIKNLFQ